jgi:hypothetical protein
MLYLFLISILCRKTQVRTQNALLCNVGHQTHTYLQVGVGRYDTCLYTHVYEGVNHGYDYGSGWIKLSLLQIMRVE